MEKLVKRILWAALVAALLLTLHAADTAIWRYSCKGTVTTLSGGIVTVTDVRGEVWDFYGGGFTVGEKVKCRFDMRHTQDFSDDALIDVKGLE